MKKTIFTAMMLIGMMGSAQTINNPILVQNYNSTKDKVWYKDANDLNAITYSDTSINDIISYTESIIKNIKGSVPEPDGIVSEGNIVMYEWYITETKVLRLILNEKSSLIVLREF